MSANVTTTPTPSAANVAFDFVRSLAGELSAGKVDLPSFPEIAIRVRRVLADPDSSSEHVVRVVGSEAALAARLVRIANSASFNRSGRAVTDLRTAISRIGYNMVRSAAMSFALAQIRNANKLAGLEHHLKEIWERSTRVAAFGYVLARAAGGVNPDEALLGGVIHGIGKLYVLTRAGGHPELFADPGTLDRILADWHAAIGKAILENWGFSEEMACAIGDQDNHARAEPAPPDLKDVVAIAVVMGAHFGDPDALEAALKGLPTAERFGLDPQKTRRLMAESALEVSALSSALGD